MMTYNEFIQDIINTRGQWNIPNNTYYEVHHILPRCLGGLPEKNKHGSKHENLIWLTLPEHFLAHKLLAIENPDNRKLVYAWWRMCNKYKMISPDDYAEVRTLIYSVGLSEAHKLKIKVANTGKKLSQTHKQNLSISHKGKAPYNKNKCLTKEHKQKISIAHKGKKKSFVTNDWVSSTVWINNSSINKRINKNLLNDYLKEGWVLGRLQRAWNAGKKMSEEARQKLHSAAKNKKWYNNGIICKMCIPGTEPEGFSLGRLKFKNANK